MCQQGHTLFDHISALVRIKGRVGRAVALLQWRDPKQFETPRHVRNPKLIIFQFLNLNLTYYTTRQGSRVSCLTQTGFAAFGEWGAAHQWVPLC